MLYIFMVELCTFFSRELHVLLSLETTKHLPRSDSVYPMLSIDRADSVSSSVQISISPKQNIQFARLDYS